MPLTEIKIRRWIGMLTQEFAEDPVAPVIDEFINTIDGEITIERLGSGYFKLTHPEWPVERTNIQFNSCFSGYKFSATVNQQLSTTTQKYFKSYEETGAQSDGVIYKTTLLIEMY